MTATSTNGVLAEIDVIEAGRRLFAGPCTFAAGAAEPGQIPDTRLPEVAFAGRSNVGKSSLLNALCGRSRLAHVSQRPGRTRQINFFDLSGRLMLADLPGYGYAQASKAEIGRWNRLMASYMRGRAPLRRVCLLIDARRGIGDSDREIMKLLDTAAQAYQIVLTKIDLVAAGELAGRVDQTQTEARRHPAALVEIALTSAQKGTGIPELRAALAALALAEVSRKR